MHKDTLVDEVSSASALAEAEETIRTLREGLERRTLIGQAVGILMMRRQLTSTAAFAHLSAMSQDRNVKVRDLARQIVDGVNATLEPSPPA